MADDDRAPHAPEAPRAPSRLARDTEGRILGGVCTGLGRHTGIDPVVYRVAFAILVFAHGQGIMLYMAAALFMPAAPGRAALAERLFRRRFDAAGVLSILGALLCAAVAFSLLGTGLLGAGVSTDTVAVLTVFGLVMLAAHGRGVDLAAAARAFPERLQGHPPVPEDEAEGKPMAVSFEKRAHQRAPGGDLPEGMIDLARFSGPRAAAPPAANAEPAGATAAVERCRGGHSPLTSVTLLAALAAGAAVFPAARAHEGPQAAMIVSATALAVVGGGLLLGGWFRSRGLAVMGTVLTCALLTSSVAAEAPPGARYGEVEWRPVDASAAQDYKMAAGSGRLDLTALPLRPGQRVAVNAEVWFGELDVTLPKAARIEVDARVGLGDLDLPGRRKIGGPNARSTEVLEPEGPRAENPPVIVLRIRSRFGDVQVTRG
ncbi:PspC domain-containing protein [Actinomadura sp. 21ATH]|uniref:PspC domain-containing protein n=1 Tax=Actinomadura sp. 21ATH TaxID=1735444 RepID=UPI0035BEEE85